MDNIRPDTRAELALLAVCLIAGAIALPFITAIIGG